MKKERLFYLHFLVELESVFFQENLTSAILYVSYCVIIIAIKTVLSVDGHNKLNLA